MQYFSSVLTSFSLTLILFSGGTIVKGFMCASSLHSPIAMSFALGYDL